jgi:hypothetical protein
VRCGSFDKIGSSDGRAVLVSEGELDRANVSERARVRVKIWDIGGGGGEMMLRYYLLGSVSPLWGLRGNTYCVISLRRVKLLSDQ